VNIFVSYIRDFLKTVDSQLLILTCAFAAIIIFLNYRYGIEPRILYNISNRFLRFAGFYVVYLIAFAVPYLFIMIVKPEVIYDNRSLWLMILLAPAVFALKVNFSAFSDWIYNHIDTVRGRYLSIIVNLPSKLLVVFILLFEIWWLGNYQAPLFGLTTKNMNFTPYLLMLLIMVPLIAWASTQNDFLRMYPKLKQVAFIDDHVPRAWV